MATTMRVVDELPVAGRRNKAPERDAACAFAKKHPGKWCMVKTTKANSNASQYAALWNAAVGKNGFEFKSSGKDVYARYTAPKTGK